MTQRAKTDRGLSIVNGETIPYKNESSIAMASGGFVLMALGSAIWVFHLTIRRWFQWEEVPFIAVLVFVVGLLLLFLAVRNALWPVTQSLVIGDDRLQIVNNNERVVEQYHYNDVRGYKVVDKVIGIDLEESPSGQTILPPKEERKYLRDNFKYDAIIEARVMCPPEELIEKLNDRLKKYRQANPEG
jgi:hypothetical protein